MHHQPGEKDESVEAVHAMSFDDRIALNNGFALFLAALKKAPGVLTTNRPQTITGIGSALVHDPGRDAFLKRAAVLHSDAAIHAGYGDSATFQPGLADAASSARLTPLLSNNRLTLDQDGEVLGTVPANWNWPFARSLLDQLSTRTGRDPFVGTWYHATLAYMLQQGLYGEMTTHLSRAVEVLPDDARILFDQGCYAEVLGLPKNQVLLSDADILALQARRAGRTLGTQGVASLKLGIPLEIVTNENAERLYRRVLRADPAYTEARVRLGRLLIVRKRHDEAAAELATALGAQAEGPVAYYARLFAGRAAQALGRIDAAAGHYREAQALFPGAQSALLGQSQLALLAASVPGTVAPLEQLGGLGADE
jgi:tetratricopeptide (TPR) repeat protein